MFLFHLLRNLFRLAFGSVVVVMVLLCPSFSYGQRDSTKQVSEQLTKADTAVSKVNEKIDAGQSKINTLLSPDFKETSKQVLSEVNKSKRDSIRFDKKKAKQKKEVQRKQEAAKLNGESTGEFQKQLDSLDQLKYTREKKDSNIDTSPGKVNTSKQKFISKADSLKGLNPSLSTSTYTGKLDSVGSSSLIKGVNKVQSTITESEQKLNTPVNNVESKVNEKLGLMHSEGGAGANLPGNINAPDAGVNVGFPNNPSLPQVDINASNPLAQADNPLQDQMSGMDEVKNQLNDVKGLPQEQIGKIKSMDELQGAHDKLGQANSITDKAQGYGDDVKNLSQGNLNELKETPKALEAQAAKIDEVAGIQKEAGQLNQLEGMTSEEGAKERMKQEALKEAQNSFTAPIDHFADKGEVLKSTMDKVSKLKGKYSSLSSLENISKRKPNEMKGKPFIERLIPGLTVQIQKAKGVWIDYNPYIGYRFYGKFTAGIGWNERVSVGKHIHFSFDERIFGPRVFADFKIGKGFSVRTDIEKMNTFVPQLSAAGLTGDSGNRAWVWSAFIGLKKEYQFIKKVRGNAQFLYNLYDDHYNSPYTDRFAVRMGFEFPLKKKTKLSPHDEPK